MADDERRSRSSTTRPRDIVRVFDDPAAIDAAAGTRCSPRSRRPRRSCATSTCARCTHRRSAVADTGWAPHFLVVERGGALLAACPLYLKDHSYGEYVFDWAWADAYQRHGLATTRSCSTRCRSRRCRARACWRATPTRPRAAAARRSSSWRASRSSRRRTCCSSTTPTSAAARDAGWMMRSTRAVPLDQPRADAVRRLRRLPRQPAARQAQEDPAGAAPRRRGRRRPSTVATRRRRSTQADWDFFYRCYTLTYRAHHSTPYLTRDFFAPHGARRCREHWLLFIALARRQAASPPR